jgi:hypothetical protein
MPRSVPIKEIGLPVDNKKTEVLPKVETATMPKRWREKFASTMMSNSRPGKA